MGIGVTSNSNLLVLSVVVPLDSSSSGRVPIVLDKIKMRKGESYLFLLLWYLFQIELMA